ncbi:MAG TPA: hypothetical protein VI306_20100 [Pyrinomonadaceae bacterium]
MKIPASLSWLQSDKFIRPLQFIVGVVAIGLIFWKLQFSTSAICCGDFDGYYHIKWTQELWDSIKTHTFVPSFPWLPLTTLNPKEYVDHHLLFHLILIPFTRSADPRLGAKISSALFGGLAVMLCYVLLMRYRIRYVLIWLLALLACSAPFLFRLNMAKAPPFAIIYLIIAIHFLFQKRYWPLLIIAFLFTETYDVFPLLFIATLIWAAVIGWTERRIEWRPVMWVSLGIVAGLVINPYFPQNLHLMYEHARIKITASDFNTKVGGEWYPYDTWEFLRNSLVACVAMVVGYVALEPGDRKRGHYPLFFALFSSLLFILILRWRRMAEYWPPFAVLFAAFSLQPWIEGVRSSLTRLPTDIMEELEPFFDRDAVVLPEQKSQLLDTAKIVAVSVIALILGVVLFINLRDEKEEIGKSNAHNYYQRGAQWLVDHVPEGHIIFNTDWDDFPRLFYYDSNHRYVSGLDPSYLYDKNPDLSELYERITLGNEDDPGPLIRDRFGATYVFSDNGHEDFFAKARESGWFEIVYEDQQCTIMRIRDEKLSPAEQDSESPADEPGVGGNRP